jgi:hypothetical protein
MFQNVRSSDSIPIGLEKQILSERGAVTFIVAADEQMEPARGGV